MHGPASLGWLLVALCAATGAYCLLRMRSGVEEQRRAAGGEALMGFGMAAMAVPAAVFSAPSWVWPAGVVVFGVAALHALWAARASAHHLHHLVGTSAMVYMAVVMAASPGQHAGQHGGQHGGHGGSGVPLVTGALLLYFAGYVLLSGARLIPAATTGGDTGGAVGGDMGGAVGGAVGWRDRPELARACRLAMGIAMVTMLLTL
ncbi:hypothetical protein M2271_000747 [Streptomyces sp. LBL]|uniref:DUF5134 domain-containing protein n=1 Tax=Streptomyces sp. LBL TaxID=2940562 RepID=UPI002476E7B0|nr:DUF5134 domain-containing protein [Streptomyces sp. LBL]MDH6622960.1 hypothetical protein [Streptomyces sp. LBL]